MTKTGENNKEKPSPQHAKSFKFLTSRKERLWIQLQNCYNLIDKLPDKTENFKVSVGLLEKKRDEFQSILDDLDGLSLEHEDFEIDTVQLSAAFNDLYVVILSKYKEIESNTPPPPIKSRPRIPEIQIKKFDGSPEKFSAFISLFDSLVHTSDLSDIDKFSYLVGYLEGSALKLVQTVTFAPENYMIAYNLLVDRFTKKRLMANHYLSHIFSLSPIKGDSIQLIEELINVVQPNVTALRALNIANLEDYILLDFVLRTLDLKTRKEFETKYFNVDFPTLENLIVFLKDKCDVSKLMSTSVASSSKTSPQINIKYADKKRVHIAIENSLNTVCSLCKENHKLIKCTKFLDCSPLERYDLVKKYRHCFSCLGTHKIVNCTSKLSCRICGNKTHNTLLHFDNNLNSKSKNNSPSVESNSASVTFAELGTNNKPLLTLLGTARAQIRSSSGQWFPCRLVLDTGSQVNFITSRLANKLGLRQYKCPYSINGIGKTTLDRPRGLVNCSISPLTLKKPIVHFDAVILPRITAELPTVPLSSELVKRFSHLNLADSHFDKPSEIDILLGVGTFFDITPEFSSNIKGNPSAILTSLGWVIMGSVPDYDYHSFARHSMFTHIVNEPSLDTTLRSFWESEKVTLNSKISPEEVACEEYFRDTITRDGDGRYIVRLPFKDACRPSLGSNRAHALSRFRKLEISFRRNPQLYELYCQNIRDYISQGHLVPATTAMPYILTHHGVYKGVGDNKAVRVVFNPAEKDNQGSSLNDTLLSGPKLQSDISQLITRFRLHEIALTCDVRQMFREVKLHPDDCLYQHIFWRFSPNESIVEWEHTRVIFGATCSPFLAQRTLQQLVEDEGANFPLASAAMRTGVYVDDILCGANDVPPAILLKNQLIALLKLGGFHLGKWASSDNSVIDSSSNISQTLPTSSSSSAKILGSAWNSKLDYFHYVVTSSNDIVSKRSILSRIARTYDINGFLSPFTFHLKCIMQRLWLLNVGWDDDLPADITQHWNKILNEFELIQEISIPRCIIPVNRLRCRLVGFSDASMQGMAAVVYCRVELEETILVNIVIAKSRVAPLKTWTIPRLEHGAACLLSKLLNSIKPSFDSIAMDTPICMTDSTVVLAWLSTPPHMLKTFVSNRVTQILEYAPDAIWRHVPGIYNPADPASRGLMPGELVNSSLWWRGPDFLYKPIDEWPGDVTDLPDELPEVKNITIVSHISLIDSSRFVDLFDRVSNLCKLQRILAYFRRYIHNLKVNIRKSSVELSNGSISAKEYSDALYFAARITQIQHLNLDIRLLENGQLYSKRYGSLSPFLDSQGLVRVGGRLKHSNLSKNSCHPLLIPSNSRLAVLLVDYFHLYSGHGGPQLIQSLLHRNFWIPSSRNLIRKRVFCCLKCYRFKAEPVQPVMSDLPSYRVQPSRTFSHTGLDFAGPFYIKAALTRTNRSVKCYVALFVCMVTKAIHLEAVTSLTTDGCLAALDRFVGRRGLPARLYTDQGRNFKGAAREITEITQLLNSSKEKLDEYLSSRKVEWCLVNPPYAPNFGGIWEAGVKSFKYHFKRVVGEQVLSFEEFNTILVRIEGILNSRPLCSVSNSPDDGFDYLTPGHFLIGGPILSRPELNLLDEKINLLTRWQLTSQLVQSFWKRWSKEYLHSQLFRPKWVKGSQTVAINDVVFWYSPGMPPTQWPKGRVTQLISGADGVPRIARIQTGTGEIMRPLCKVITLPPQ